MAYRLFVINNEDFTSFIRVPTYMINKLPVYNEWQDANGTYHRDIYRTSVEGSFTLWFDSHEDYFNFYKIINANTTSEGWILLTLYLNNEDDVYTSKFFLSMTPKNELPYMGMKAHEGFEISVKEK